MGVIMLFVGLLELIAEFARIISFSFRLFGNVFAGEVLLLVMAFLIPYIASLPFYGLELFVGFIQALVFMMLALVFFTLSTQGHGGEAHRGEEHH
jgi:F-type H+-transporting ATPase subunit a